MITVITGSNSKGLLDYAITLTHTTGIGITTYPEHYLGPVGIFNWCKEYVGLYQNSNTAIVTLSIDVVNCINQITEKHYVSREFILVTADGIQNCGINAEPVFKEFNKLYTLLDNLWEEEKQ
jgi:hypothetical protein